MEQQPNRRRTNGAKGTRRTGSFIVLGLLVACAVALLLGPEASTEPDGLNKVAIDHGFDGTERTHAFDDTPVAGYSLAGIENERLATGLAGVIGVAVTFALGAGIIHVTRRRTNNEARDPSAAGAEIG